MPNTGLNKTDSTRKKKVRFSDESDHKKIVLVNKEAQIDFLEKEKKTANTTFDTEIQYSHKHLLSSQNVYR